MHAQDSEKRLEELLTGEVKYFAVRKNNAFCFTVGTCDCDELIMVMDDRMVLLKHKECGEDGTIIGDIVTSFDENEYSLIEYPENGTKITFEKLLISHDDPLYTDGTFYGIKYRYGDGYLFVYCSEYNLIILKCNYDNEDPYADFPEQAGQHLFINEKPDK